MQLGNISDLLAEREITASAPCRIDFGGTLDISTFHYPLRHLMPATVNIALDRRTTVRLKPADDDRVHITASGIADAIFAPSTAPYDHPLGLMFAVADYFNAAGVHIEIDSTSPPRSGLGGSSVAAVALIAAFSKAGERLGKTGFTPERTALVAHAVEQGVAGVPCGLQDQLAAAFGGVNRWDWPALPDRPPYRRTALMGGDASPPLDRHLLVAYLGLTHVSKDVNSTWVRRFIAGSHRDTWHAIIALTHRFAEALGGGDLKRAAAVMNQETALRKAMTPNVLESMGDRLAAAAIDAGCGARFTGAGGGGCLWAIGEADAIGDLKPVWQKLLAERATAELIDCKVAVDGVR